MTWAKLTALALTAGALVALGCGAEPCSRCSATWPRDDGPTAGSCAGRSWPRSIDARDVMRLRNVSRVRAWTVLTQLHRRRCLRRVARAKPGRGAQPARYRLTFRVWRAFEAHRSPIMKTRAAARTAASTSSLGG